MKVLVLGVSGMLGNSMFRTLSEDGASVVIGTTRTESTRRYFSPALRQNIISGVDVENQDSLARVIDDVRPQVVVNCIGLIKQLSTADDPLQALPINSIFPHRLARLCGLVGSRVVHISTDCVFSGRRGGYRESDFADANDLYGRSKYLGEVSYPHTITLRTSIIGHELTSANALLCWFLSQQGPVRGYSKAIFSGLPTVELARVVRDIIIPRSNLSGLYHVASSPIAKYDLLKLVAEVYDKEIEIVPDDSLVIDRSLNSDLFNKTTGYIAPSWPELVARMSEHK